MINEAIINPRSIVVIGGSNHLSKPGGKMVKNLIDGGFTENLFIVNPAGENVQGQKTFSMVEDIPQVDLAILAVKPDDCLQAIKVLLKEKGTRGFIIISAGFAEGGEEGRKIEDEITELINQYEGCLIGPNCIGYLSQKYYGVFTSPIPELDPQGCDLISSSGGVALFIMEAGMINGLRFSSVFSIGNGAQTGVEEVLAYMDRTYQPGVSAPIKLLYLETIRDPAKLLKHASSLIRKGACIAGIKSGSTEAGSRAAASHTGAIATSDMAVRALFRKAGIVYCSSREELITVAGIFNSKKPKGKNIAIITHAGGSAVMLSDSLSRAGMNVPLIDGPNAKELLAHLHPGSYVRNPIDFLATGTAEQLDLIIDYCENKFDNIDAMVVVFGSAGLFNIANVYNVLNEKLETCKKPIYPVLPSVINAHKEIEGFLASGHINFPDEVVLGTALGAIYNTPDPVSPVGSFIEYNEELYDLIKDQEDGFLENDIAFKLLQKAGIPIVQQATTTNLDEAFLIAEEIGYPVAVKVVGPLHKSDVHGVFLNIRNKFSLEDAFHQIQQIHESEGVLIQSMHGGLELFIGAKKEDGLGHMVVFGLGGIFVEVFNDVQAGLAPLEQEEINLLMKNLKGYPLIQGIRGKKGINEQIFIDLIINVSRLIEQIPEIVELDINPLMASADQITAVDCRVRIARENETAEVESFH